MPIYRVSGFTFTSTITFPELVPVRAARPDCRLVRGVRPVAPARPTWYHAWSDAGGGVWTRLARVRGGYLLRFPRLCDFLVSRDASRVRVRPSPATPIETIRHLFLNQVWPLVLAERGRIVLHASAVVTPAGAVAFLGATGLGKSTLAAGFAAAGDALVTDDCLLIEVGRGRPRAVPGYPSVRLWPGTARRLHGGRGRAVRAAHYTSKLRVPAAPRFRFALRPVRLVKAYVLDPPARPAPGRPAATITALGGRAALAELIGHLYRLDVGEAAVLRRDFDRLASLAERLPLARLRPARGLAHLADVRRAVLEDVEVRSENAEV